MKENLKMIIQNLIITMNQKISMQLQSKKINKRLKSLKQCKSKIITIMMNSSSGSNNKMSNNKIIIIMARIMDTMITIKIKRINQIIITIRQIIFHQIYNSLNQKLIKCTINQIFQVFQPSIQLSSLFKNLLNQKLQMYTKKIINFNLMKISFLKCLCKKILNKNHLIILNHIKKIKMNNLKICFNINRNHKKINYL